KPKHGNLKPWRLCVELAQDIRHHAEYRAASCRQFLVASFSPGKDRLPALPVNQLPTGFLQHEQRGGNIPVMRVCLDETGVKGAVGYHRQPICKGGNVGHPPDTVLPCGRNAIEQSLWPGDFQHLLVLAHFEASAIAEGSLAG